MCLPVEIRQLIMKEVFDSDNMFIEMRSDEGKGSFKPSFDIATLQVCKQMKSENLPILMSGIELRATSICAIPFLVELPSAIRECIRWLRSSLEEMCYAGGPRPRPEYLKQSILSGLPSLKSIYVDYWLPGEIDEYRKIEVGIEVVTALNMVELQTALENGDALNFLIPEFEAGGIRVDSLRNLESVKMVGIEATMISNWDFRRNVMDDEVDIVDVSTGALFC